MRIYFKTTKLQKQCSVEKEMRKSFGQKMCAMLQQRLMELGAADNLGDISYLPPARCHELINRNGVFSVNLEHPLRLLFIPANDPMPRKPDGGIDLQQVTELEVIAIEDTHDKKNQRRSNP
jgi:proteic killer suppression protein